MGYSWLNCVHAWTTVASHEWNLVAIPFGVGGGAASLAFQAGLPLEFITILGELKCMQSSSTSLFPLISESKLITLFSQHIPKQ